MKDRARKLLLYGLLFLLAGLGYAVFCRVAGWALPCPLHLVTGLRCPGCGVTRACLALLSGDLVTAWHSNPGLLAVLPLLLLLAVRLALRYLRTGRNGPVGWEKALLWGLIAYLLLWGVLRNLLWL